MMGITPDELLNMNPTVREFAVGIATQKEVWRLEKLAEIWGG
jgi:hypothetical protein